MKMVSATADPTRGSNHEQKLKGWIINTSQSASVHVIGWHEATASLFILGRVKTKAATRRRRAECMGVLSGEGSLWLFAVF